METVSRSGPDAGTVLPESGSDNTERGPLQDEQGSNVGGRLGHSTSKIGSSRGARWGQCVYYQDGDEFDETGGGGGPGGSEGLTRDSSRAFSEENKVPSETDSQNRPSI